MLGLGAMFALEITTATPDALCPPLEEARSAVRARVGEVRGAFEAEFSLVRSADGVPSLDLVVRESGAIRLQRSLPLEGVGCEDAAQAIALVLERFFDGVERGPTSSDVGTVPVVVETKPTPSPPKVSDLAERGAAPKRGDARRWELRIGATQDWEYAWGPSVGVTYYPAAFRLGPSTALALSFDAAVFAQKTTELVREQQIHQSTWETALSLPWLIDLDTVALGIGPRAQVRWQRAEGPSLARAESKFRALPGVGGAVLAGWSFWRDWALGAEVSFGAQLTRLTPSFVLRQELEGPQPVLTPQPWFGEARVAVSISL